MDAKETRAARGTLEVWAQPQVELRTGRLCGAEALVRRRGGDGALIPPDEFIPAMERSGEIVALDEAVLRGVCAGVRAAAARGVWTGPVCVNLSRLHLAREGAAECLERIVAQSGAPRGAVVFELTESAACRDGAGELEHLVGKLRAMGFRTSLDDFGIGFSSLKLLADARFDMLKIDRHFVARIGAARADEIVRAALELAGRLGMRAVAEGVETPAQAEFLRRAGCYAAQGYLYFRPMPWEEYVRLAAEEARAL